MGEFCRVDTSIHKGRQLDQALAQFVRGKDAMKIVEAVKTEAAGVRVPLERELIGHLRWREANAELALQQNAISVADREILGVM